MQRLFSAKLRWLRQQRGSTQASLAENLGLKTQAHVANLEAERDTPSLDLVLRIARLFGVTTDYLLRDTISVEATSAAADMLTPPASEYSNKFGAKLRMLRERYGWGQTELARRLGLARRGYISNLEAGRKLPSLEVVVRIADLFGVTTDALLRDEVQIPAEDTT